MEAGAPGRFSGQGREGMQLRQLALPLGGVEHMRVNRP